MKSPDSSCCTVQQSNARASATRPPWRSHRVLSGVALGAFALLCACGDDGVEITPADAGPPTALLGSGDRDFEALTNGDTILIVQGPQDGYHFFGSVVATNINAGDSKNLASADNPTTTFEVFMGAQRVDAMASNYTQGLKVTNRGAEMIGRNVILDIQDDSELDGAQVRFVVTIDDVDGVSVSDERNLVAMPHPNNQ